MKYAIILRISKTKTSYLLGFTNTKIKELTTEEGSIKYTIKLKELSSIFVKLTGDAAIYLS